MPATDRCEPGFRKCAWQPQTRIAWLHPPKTGTSFLLSLARLANSSLPDGVAVPPETRRDNRPEWERFFGSYPPHRWFRASDVWWNGLSHAALDDATYTEFRGRLFAMFRDPRSRGWSAWNYFVAGDSEAQALWPPARYAKCLAGSVVGMLTGRPRTANKPFGTVGCHLPPRHPRNGSLLPHVDCSCAPNLTPDVGLAVSRVDEGFAFAGLVEEWALSICLLAAKFGMRCLPKMFANSRPTRQEGARVAASTYKADPALFRVFDDYADAALYEHVRRRFDAETRRLNVSRERCAREVCPLAARYFA